MELPLAVLTLLRGGLSASLDNSCGSKSLHLLAISNLILLFGMNAGFYRRNCAGL